MGSPNRLSPPKGSRFPSPEQEYVESEKSIGLRKLAKRWNLGFRTIARWSTLGKWTTKRQRFWLRVDSIEQEERAQKYARIRSRIHATNARVASKALGKIEELLDSKKLTAADAILLSKLQKLIPGIAPLARERRIAYGLEVPAGAVDDGSRAPRPEPHARDTLLGEPHPDVANPSDANAGDAATFDGGTDDEPTLPDGSDES